MKAKEFKLLTLAIESGICLGFNHAHKHEDHPSADTIKHRIQDAVMNEICDWFHFDEIED
jgi:hypothetical protein